MFVLLSEACFEYSIKKYIVKPHPYIVCFLTLGNINGFKIKYLLPKHLNTGFIAYSTLFCSLID